MFVFTINAFSQFHRDDYYAAGEKMEASSSTENFKGGWLALEVLSKPSEGTEGCSTISFTGKQIQYLNENLKLAREKYIKWRDTAIEKGEKDMVLDIDPVKANAKCTGTFRQWDKFCVATKVTTNIRFVVTTENDVTKYQIAFVTGYMFDYNNRSVLNKAN